MKKRRKTLGFIFNSFKEIFKNFPFDKKGDISSKWSEADVEALRESLTKFAHELDTISERVQSRTM